MALKFNHISIKLINAFGSGVWTLVVSTV